MEHVKFGTQEFERERERRCADADFIERLGEEHNAKIKLVCNFIAGLPDFLTSDALRMAARELLAGMEKQ